MHEIAEAIRSELSHLGTAEGIEKTKHYFREPIQTYGCTSSDAKNCSNAVFTSHSEEPRFNPHRCRRSDDRRRHGGELGRIKSHLQA